MNFSLLTQRFALGWRALTGELDHLAPLPDQGAKGALARLPRLSPQQRREWDQWLTELNRPGVIPYQAHEEDPKRLGAALLAGYELGPWVGARLAAAAANPKDPDHARAATAFKLPPALADMARGKWASTWTNPGLLNEAQRAALAHKDWRELIGGALSAQELLAPCVAYKTTQFPERCARWGLDMAQSNPDRSAIDRDGWAEIVEQLSLRSAEFAQSSLERARKGAPLALAAPQRLMLEAMAAWRIPSTPLSGKDALWVQSTVLGSPASREGLAAHQREHGPQLSLLEAAGIRMRVDQGNRACVDAGLDIWSAFKSQREALELNDAMPMSASAGSQARATRQRI